MLQTHRITTNVGEDQRIVVELNQTYDLIELLSLRFTQKDIYSSVCSDYGVVCGRVTTNNGLAVPNARVSIFVPLSETDELDPVISVLYPFKTIDDKNENDVRYNLLPSRKQHSGHEPVGTFPDQVDILTREEILEIYEKYYKYTVKTNSSGDFMIWGVPLGEQTLHIDIDLSDIGCFSLRPNDFIRKGVGLSEFKTTYEFKSSNDLDSLPQIVSFNKSITVTPFWGEKDLCEIGITRVDYDLSESGIFIEPKAFFIGSVYTDTSKKIIDRYCNPSNAMGRKCGLTTGPAKIEVIRFTNKFDENNKPILEFYEINEDIEDDGSFMFPLPMNLDYLYTNEFGENIITNDSKRGVPTTAAYRFRITMLGENTKKRSIGSYLIPNIREYSANETEIDKSYSFSTNWDDYPTGATNDNVIFYNEEGSYYPKDYFYRLSYNKVYTLSSFMGSYFSPAGVGRSTHLGLKEISPKEEDDCENNIVTPPINFGVSKLNFSILIAIITTIFERIILNTFIGIIQVFLVFFQNLYEWRIDVLRIIKDYYPFNSTKNKSKLPVVIDLDTKIIEPLQRFGTVTLGVVNYPECEKCNDVDEEDDDYEYTSQPEPTERYQMVLSGLVFPDIKYVNNPGYSGDGDVIPDLQPQYNKLYLTVPNGKYPQPTYNSNYGVTIQDVYENPNRFIVRIDGLVTIEVNRFTYYFNNLPYFYIENSVFNINDPINTNAVTVEFFDTNAIIEEIPENEAITIATLNLPSGCSQYKTAHDESIVYKTYCVNTDTNYDDLDLIVDLYSGFKCPSGMIPMGQVLKNNNDDGNPCKSCITKSGYSEFRDGFFRIIPALSISDIAINRKAINEYARRTLVGKLFCEGVVNYGFIDNWLSGSLYFFPFKAKIRWDDEKILDLNFRRTKYCKNLVYYKVSEKRFYYRSASYNNEFFAKSSIDSLFLNANLRYVQSDTLGYPTTIVDLGVKDEFINQICVDKNLDVNCSVSKTIGSSSYQEFKEMLGLYINYKMDVLGKDGKIESFFKNGGFNDKIPNKIKNQIFNGDILQLISINNEAGIDEFDLENTKYSIYNPTILDPENDVNFFKAEDGSLNGPFPIKLELDEEDGFNLRSCLNVPGNLTESSQTVPFYLWDKKGAGFGLGVNQSWDYQNGLVSQNLQGMTMNYSYSGDSQYILYPMSKTYSGMTISNPNNLNVLNGSDFDYEHLNLNEFGQHTTVIDNTHLLFNSQDEGFTFLYVTNGNETLSGATEGILYVRTGETGNWATINWDYTLNYLIKPTNRNYEGNKQILSTPFLYYFGIRPGKTAIDKLIKAFGPRDAFSKIE